LSAGEPWRAQAIVRTVMTTLYADSPEGIPGNDDLGTMSAWYVWSSIGLYPQFTALRNLDVGAPVFTRVVIHAPNGPQITIDAPNASDANQYVSALRVDGHPSDRPWLALPMRGYVHLALALAATPNRAWGASLADAPPALAPANVTFPPSTAARFTLNSPSIDFEPGGSATLAATLQNTGTTSTVVTWTARSRNGVQSTPNRGTVNLAPGASATVTVQLAMTSPGLYNVDLSGEDEHGAKLEPVTANVRVARAGERLPLAWIADRFNDTVVPLDTHSFGLGAPIAVLDEPRDGVLSLDNRRFFVADRAAKSVSVIDAVGNRLLANVPVGNSPNGLAIAPDGTTVWVANYDDGTIQPIDAQTLRAGAPIAVGTGPRAIAIASDGSRLYVSLQGANAVVPVDLHTRTPLAPILAGERPAGIALSPDASTLYVVNNGDDTVSVVDVRAGTTVARVPVGVEPMYIAVNPAGTLAYVTNYATTTVTPIDLATNTAKPDVTVGGQPFDVEWMHDGYAVVILHRGNALVRINPGTGWTSQPLFLGSGGAYTIAVPH